MNILEDEAGIKLGCHDKRTSGEEDGKREDTGPVMSSTPTHSQGLLQTTLDRNRQVGTMQSDVIENTVKSMKAALRLFFC